MELHPVEVRGPDDVERALSAIAQGQTEALVVSDASRLGMHAERIGAFVVEQRLPVPDQAGWEIFPFEADSLVVKRLEAPVLPEPMTSRR